VKNFARIAQPLHNLTQKGALMYPDFDRDFILETDASGAVLSQRAEDGKVHTVAYASRSLSPQEKRYPITEFETSAVVWAVSHFHVCPYGHDVHVFTDYSAVKAVLETLSGEWSKLFGSGVRNVQITYR
jgi:hypothetical protein